MYCYRCKYDLRELGDARYCPECGAPFHPHRPQTYRATPEALPPPRRRMERTGNVPPTGMYCYKCKYDLHGLGDARHCPECGAPFHPDVPETYRISPDAKPIRRHPPSTEIPPSWIESFGGFWIGVVAAIIVSGILSPLRGEKISYGVFTPCFSPVRHVHDERYTYILVATLFALIAVAFVIQIRLRRPPHAAVGLMTGMFAAAFGFLHFGRF